MAEAEADYVFKVLVLGDANVGKSSLIRRFHENRFDIKLYTTVGVDFFIHDMELDGKKVKLQLWDTAGQEKYKALTSTYYRGAHGALIVFDLTSNESFKNVKDYWLNEFHRESGLEPIVIIVGNKSDLEKERKVLEEEIQDFCRLYSLSWVETSAKSSINIKETFETLARKLMANYDELVSLAPSNQSGPGSFTLHGAYNVPEESQGYLNYCSCGTLQ